MDNELFDLCKEVSDRTGWKDTQRDYYDLVYLNPFSGTASEGSRKLQPITVYERQMYYDKNEHMSAIKICPEYTSDYLLEKLPKTISESALDLKADYSQYVARYVGIDVFEPTHFASADTPLKALLKLTIALDDAGVKL